jgi:hypothetical protein
VNAADKDRNKPEPTYQFTGSKNKQRTFYQLPGVNPYTGSSS